MTERPEEARELTPEDVERFLQLFARYQRQILAFVYSLVPHAQNAEDIFQKTSLVLWRKFYQLQPDGAFLPWACRVAHLEVCNFRRTAARDRLRFSDALLDHLAEDRVADLSETNWRLAALRECVQQLALLRFDGGAVAILLGDALVDLESRGSLRLSYGNLSVRAPEEAIGFTVRTPASDVVDLGTEFAVEVKRNGATEVHVLDGMVEFRDPAKHAGSGHLLSSGQAVGFGNATAAQPIPVTFRAKPIDQMLREAKPKPREDLLIVYEGFQHDAGTLPLADADGGWGWRRPWRRRRLGERNAREPQSPREMRISFQKLRVPWPIRGGRAGMLEMTPGNEYLVRPLQEPVDLAKDRVYYISMMIREDLAAKQTTTPNRDESARLTFRSSDDYWGDRVCFGLSQHRTPHIEVADFIRFTGPEVSGGQTMIWVAKIAAQRRGEDEIFFRVYQEGESLDIFEPANWSITSRGVRSDAKLDLLLLSSTGGTRRWFDEIRIGTSWRAAIPIAQRTKVASDQLSEERKEREH